MSSQRRNDSGKHDTDKNGPPTSPSPSAYLEICLSESLELIEFTRAVSLTPVLSDPQLVHILNWEG